MMPKVSKIRPSLHDISLEKRLRIQNLRKKAHFASTLSFEKPRIACGHNYKSGFDVVRFAQGVAFLPQLDVGKIHTWIDVISGPKVRHRL